MTDAYERLHERIAAKKAALARQEATMRWQLEGIREHLSPGRLLKSAVKDVVTEVKTSPGEFISSGLKMGAGFLADRLLFRKRGFLVRTIGMFAVRRLVNKFTSSKDENEE